MASFIESKTTGLKGVDGKWTLAFGGFLLFEPLMSDESGQQHQHLFLSV